MRKEAGVGEEGRAPTPEGPWAGEATLASGDGTGQLPSPTKQLRAVRVAAFHLDDQMLSHHLPDAQEKHGGQRGGGAKAPHVPGAPSLQRQLQPWGEGLAAGQTPALKVGCPSGPCPPGGARALLRDGRWKAGPPSPPLPLCPLTPVGLSTRSLLPATHVPESGAGSPGAPGSCTGPASNGGQRSGHNIAPSTRPAGLKPSPAQRCPCPQQDKTAPRGLATLPSILRAAAWTASSGPSRPAHRPAWWTEPAWPRPSSWLPAPPPPWASLSPQSREPCGLSRTLGWRGWADVHAGRDAGWAVLA